MTEKELALMEGYCSEFVQKLQKAVKKKCDLLDYEGSRIYDSCPDRYMLDKSCAEIVQSVEAEEQITLTESDLKQEFIQVLFLHEVFRRRSQNQFDRIR